MSSTIYIDEIPNSVLQDIEGNENLYITFDLNTEIEEVGHTDHWCYGTDTHYTTPECGCVAKEIESVEIESVNSNQAVQLSSDQLKDIMNKLREYIDNADNDDYLTEKLNDELESQKAGVFDPEVDLS